jgi:hypothetical protein
MASDRAVSEPQAESHGGRAFGAYVVAGIVLVSALGAAAVWRDARTTSPVMSVPAAVALPRPTTAAVARRDTLAFVPSGANVSVADAVAAATGTTARGLAARARVAPLAGGGWAVTLTVPVNERALLRSGRIFTGPSQGASDLRRGLLQVTAGQIQYVVRTGPATGQAVFAFRLARSGRTLSAVNWNANAVLSQTEVGDDLVP